MKVLMTGATGFLGRILLNCLGKHLIRIYSRSCSNATYECIEGNLDDFEKFPLIVKDIDVVVHCAARAHVMNETVSDPIHEYRKINTVATLNLAKSAAERGVGRFIYISSIKVHGERNFENKAIVEDEQLEPVDPYGISKLEAEIGLRKIAEETGMEVVIIRPPLIYGPGVKANFESVMKWLYKGIPLPLGAVNNRRSLVGIDNLCDFIKLCIEHPNAANQSFLISDQDDVSTTELLNRLKSAMNSKSALLPVPTSLMTVGAKLVGKGTVAQRLFDDLYVSSNKATELLGWKPPFTMEEQLKKTAQHFLEKMNQG